MKEKAHDQVGRGWGVEVFQRYQACCSRDMSLKATVHWKHMDNLKRFHTGEGLIEATGLVMQNSRVGWPGCLRTITEKISHHFDCSVPTWLTRQQWCNNCRTIASRICTTFSRVRSIIRSQQMVKLLLLYSGTLIYDQVARVNFQPGISILPNNLCGCKP